MGERAGGRANGRARHSAAAAAARRRRRPSPKDERVCHAAVLGGRLAAGAVRRRHHRRRRQSAATHRPQSTRPLHFSFGGSRPSAFERGCCARRARSRVFFAAFARAALRRAALLLLLLWFECYDTYVLFRSFVLCSFNVRSTDTNDVTKFDIFIFPVNPVRSTGRFMGLAKKMEWFKWIRKYSTGKRVYDNYYNNDDVFTRFFFLPPFFIVRTNRERR